MVDDKLDNIRFLSDFLSKQNYQIRKAISGEAALVAVQTLPPDLILLDINMPIMGGYEVCQTLKNDPKTSSIPIIFLSAGDSISDKVKAFEVGGIDYITKPFHLEEVLARVHTQLTVQQLQNELKTKNQQLENTILELKHTQYQLIQKEKIVSAGRITAGISHEINNPLNFIIGNINPAVDYTQIMINIIRDYQQKFPQPNSKIIGVMDDEIDLEFLIEDFTRIMKSIRTGAERIRPVVCAMHIFSRLNQSAIKKFNVCESIDSVLMILSDQIHLQDQSSGISICKKYSNVPLLTGYPNLLTQVLTHLLQNAIDSFDPDLMSMMDSLFEPTIWITVTTLETNQIMISIKDNGIGIYEENQLHLFEPFFTTKSVGKGVGLGLFTSYQIITEIYKGTLSYNNCPEGGSEFVIKIPGTANFS
ncbi:MAG: sensor histidine kinase [Cuspidothrix sp.]